MMDGLQKRNALKLNKKAMYFVNREKSVLRTKTY